MRPRYPLLRHWRQPLPWNILSLFENLMALGSLTSLGLSSVLQPGQITRTRRWAITPMSVLLTRNGSTPMSIRRVAAEAASLVCSVEKTKWPVSDARVAACAVSRSRISPIITTSGSWRKMARRPMANDMPTLWSTGIWFTPSRLYSTGSSVVISFFSGPTMALSAAYSVVVLPLPVGPVTRMMPCGLVMRV